MNQSRNFTSLLNPSYLQDEELSPKSAAAAAAAAAAAVSAAIANGTSLVNSQSKKREAEDKEKEDRRKRRKSRWGGNEHEKTFIPGMPTVLPTNLTPEQERAYLFQLQIEEISRKLRTGDLGIPLNPEERFEQNLTTNKFDHYIHKICLSTHEFSNPQLGGSRKFSNYGPPSFCGMLKKIYNQPGLKLIFKPHHTIEDK